MTVFSSLRACASGTMLAVLPCLTLAVEVPDAALGAEIVFLGEQHDNLAHHQLQAAWTSGLQPKALVFEMLTPQQAEKITDQNRSDETLLEKALDWEGSGWPSFSMYYPIFAAAPKAKVYGAGVPRDRLGDLMQHDVVAVIGADAATRFALDEPLTPAEQEAREALQRSAHCDALPEELLPRMVDVQRVRDAALAGAALDALAQVGGPVVVITGNGHAREDWGAPFLVSVAAPDVTVFSLGQGEAGSEPLGGFDVVVDGPAVDRGDPCDAFK